MRSGSEKHQSVGRVRRPSGRRRSSRAAVVTVLGVLVAGVTAVAPSPASAAPPKTKPATELPPLPTAVQPTVRPENPGDFTNPPPSPAQLDEAIPTRKDAFDPATSRVLDDETTPTRKSYANPDGTRTDILTTRPTRYRDSQGRWRDIDLSLVAGTDGILAARAAERSPRLPARADGVTTVETDKGSFGFRHPDAGAVPAVAEATAATYPGALGGRDLRLVVTTEGYEEFVILPRPGEGQGLGVLI